MRIHGLFVCTLIIKDSRVSNNVWLLYVTVIVFTSITVVFHQNFNGEILVCFNKPIQTSPDFSLKITNRGKSLHKLRLRMMTSASPSGTHGYCIAAPAVWKQIFVWKFLRTLGAILCRSEIAQKEAALYNVTWHWLDYIYRGRTNSEQWKLE